MEKEESLIHQLKELKNGYEDKIRDTESSGYEQDIVLACDKKYLKELTTLLNKFEITKRYVMEQIK